MRGAVLYALTLSDVMAAGWFAAVCANVQPGMTVFGSFAILTHRGTPSTIMLGPIASLTSEFRSARSVVNVPVVRP